MVKKNKKKVKFTSTKTWKKFTEDAVDEMPAKDFEVDNEIGEIDAPMTKATIKSAATDVLNGFSILQLAHKWGLEEEDAKAIYDAVSDRITKVN